MNRQKFKIGITGGNGVLGSILSKELKRKGYKVLNFNNDIQNIKKVQSWLKNNNFDAIFHLASLVPVKICEENPHKACSINIGGTANILESLKKIKKKPWFFYASTSHVYKIKKTLLCEDDDISPKTFYGYTKWMGEKILENFSLKNNLTYCIGRIFSFYSVSQSQEFLFPSIKKKLKENLNKKSIYIINANNIIDIQKAENVVKKILKLFEKKVDGIFNIGTGKGIKIKNFVKKFTRKKIAIKTNTRKKTTIIADMTKFNSVIKI